MKEELIIWNLSLFVLGVMAGILIGMLIWGGI